MPVPASAPRATERPSGLLGALLVLGVGGAVWAAVAEGRVAAALGAGLTALAAAGAAWCWRRHDGGSAAADKSPADELAAAHRRLAQSEHLAVVAHHTSAAMWTMDREYRIEWVNPAFENLTGHEAADALGRRPGELIHGPETSAETVAFIDREMAAGRGFKVEILHYHRSGRTFWGHTKVAPVHGPDGALQRWVAVEQDITEIRQRNSLHSAVLASAAYSLIATNEHGVIEVFNRGAELLTGYRAAEVVRRSTPAILHDAGELAERSAELGAELGEHVPPGFETFVAKARRTGLPDERDWTYVRKDSSRVPVRMAVTTMRDSAGAITGYLGIASDVSAQRRAVQELQAGEAKLREAQQVARLGSWEVDAATREMRWSEEAARLLGVGAHRSSSVERALALYVPADRGRARDAMHAALEHGAGVSFEASMRTLDRGTIRVRVSARTEVVAGRTVRVFGTTQDITELHEAEVRRRELSTRLEKIAAQVPGMVFQFKLRPDGSSCFPYASAGIREIYGVSPGEVADDASPVFGFLHHADLERFGASIRESARDLAPWVCEYRVQPDTGTVRWLLGNAVPEREPDGAVLWHGYICDITARKAVEDAARRGEERFSLIASATSDAVWDYDPRHSTLWWSDGITRLFGYARPEPRDGLGWWAERIHAEDAARAAASFASALSGETDRWEELYRFRHADGRWIMVQDRALIVRDDSGRPVRAVGGMTDISARHEAEARLRVMSERLHLATQVAHIGVWDADPISGVQHWDLGNYEIFGLDPQRDPPDGASWSRIAHPDDVERVRAVWRAMIASGDRLETEYRITRPDGSARVVRALATVQRDGAGRAVRLVGVNWDVTQERAAAAAVLAAKEQAEAATRAKSEFLANMSHEIRTPLNAVIGMGGLLLETPLTREQREFAETIRHSGDTLLTLINDILDFSKIESGSLELEQRPFDLRDCVESALDLLGAKAAEKQLDLLYWIEPDVPATLEGDVTRLRQILVNLVANAVKFTHHGEVVVEVAAAGPARLRCAVRDTGIGIPADRLDRLFKSFSQVDASTTRKFGGTGLGLAISQRLCELMGGRIRVESELGRGTTFHFEVALRPAAETTAAPPPAAGGLCGRRVLIVDDNASSRLILGRQLGAWGLETVAIDGGDAALAWLDGGTGCDLAIVDLGLPEPDGLALARAMHARPGRAALPVVLLASLGTLGAPPAAAGIAAQLSKPVKRAVLRETLAALLVGPAPGTAAPAAAHRAAKPGETQPLSILLTEDHVTNQRVAQLLLARLGYRADVAHNGLECLQALERQPYDVVLLDVQMPEMDGLTAAREINRRFEPGRRPYIVAMTANAMQGDREDCLAVGMQDYVAKPVQLRELEAALRRAYAQCHGVTIG